MTDTMRSVAAEEAAHVYAHRSSEWVTPKLRGTALRAEVAHLRAFGWPAHKIAERLHVTVSAVEKILVAQREQ